MPKEHIVTKTKVAIKVISRLEMVRGMQMFVYAATNMKETPIIEDVIVVVL